MNRAWIVAVSLLIGGLAQESGAIGYGDTQPRPMGVAGAFGAMARGAESLYWNPANLALSTSPKYSLPLTLGFSWIMENNSLNINDYNKYNGEFIDEADKEDILGKIDKKGLKFNTDLGFFLPGVGGTTFPLPWNLSSALAFNVRLGIEGEMPKDFLEMMLYGNEFARERERKGMDPNYDIAEWDGSGWGLGILSWGLARPWMPPPLKAHLSEFTVGTTFKLMGGVYSEVVRSDGGFITRVGGTRVDAYAVARGGGGTGFGIDFGAAGVTKNRKTTFSVSLVNFLDHMSWSISTQQDSVFVSGRKIRILSFTGKDDVTQVFDNPRDEKDEAIFHEEIDIQSFSRSLPAMLRAGVAHDPLPRLTLSAQYDQAFSSGFGISSVPRVALGGEYRLVEWFPVRFGISTGGRAGQSSAIGFGFGPFAYKRLRLTFLETAAVNRGGYLPGLAQGAGYSINLLRVRIRRF